MQTLLLPEHSIEARQLLQLSQAKVATESGINRAYLSQFENDKRILKDAENDALYDYYDEQGIDMDELINGVLPEEQPEVTAVKPLINTIQSPVKQLRIKDGMMIYKGLDDETVETLMIEYYALEETIVKQLEQPVIRTFLFNDVDEEATFNKALPLLLACYYQRQIKLTLQGRINSDSIVNEDQIVTMEQWLDTKRNGVS